MMSPRERYQHDPQFRLLVDYMYIAIEHAQFTPTEIREAAMLAQIKYEDVHPRPVFRVQDLPLEMREDMGRYDWYLKSKL